MTYLKINNIKINGMNMIQGHGVLTPVPVFGSVMFAHALGARIGSPVSGVLSIFHSASPDVEYIKEEGKSWFAPRLINKRGACGFFVSSGKGGGDGGDYASDSGVSMSYQPHATASATLSLVLEFETGFSLDDVKNTLKGMRFAGGNFEYGSVSACDSKEDINLQSGYVIVDASDLVKRRLESGEDIIASVMQPVTTSNLTDIEAGWHIPVNLGYAMLTDFEHRDGVRDDLLHAFAEPMIGLVKLSATRNFKSKKVVDDDGNEFFVKPEALPFWRHEWKKEDDISIFRIFQ